MPLPTKAEYPNAPNYLFDGHYATCIHNACMGKVSLQTVVDFSEKRDSAGRIVKSPGKPHERIWVCQLKLEMEEILQETALGEGPSKLIAKQAAWLHIVSKMHMGGALKELFAPDEISKPQAVDGGEPSIHPVEIDAKTMVEEKDAKVEIYNYAAGFGLIPEFEVKLVKPRVLRARRGRKSVTPGLLYQVNIRLEGQHIDVTASGKTQRTAEIAAAIAFKAQAEQRNKTMDDSPQRTSSVLNTDTAGMFFEFYKDRHRGMYIEVEHEQAKMGANPSNVVRLKMNGETVGQPANMQTKKQAEVIAYLTAAVDVASANPGLLKDFTQSLIKGKGKIMRAMTSLDLEVGFDTTQTMRNALVEAREAGLTDERLALSAEASFASKERQRYVKTLSPEAYSSASEQLRVSQEDFGNNPSLLELRSKRAALPMTSYKQQFLEMVDSNQYSIIIGATGSGKTTQVPQIIFEEAVSKNRGSSCNVICTQPRRIAATSVAQRVAVERNEPLKKTVGYQVRFDNSLPQNPYGISYCTTGILLEKLKYNPEETLDTASHIIIDEVHERDLNVDFLMIVLKRAIRLRQAESRSVPKVVLMSATLDPELFAKYFQQSDDVGSTQPCPTLQVPGRTFPVKELYLGSIMHELLGKYGSEMRRLLAEDTHSNDYLEAETIFSKDQQDHEVDSEKETMIDWKRQRTPSVFSADDTISARAEKEEALVPVSLVAATVAHITKDTADGAVLVFLPGLEEILKVQTLLLERRPLGADFSNPSKFQICLLHSTVPADQQAQIFKPSAPGCRTIILSTNIAETSVTVPDVKYIVDTGKLREKRYDQVRRITRLQCVWESMSNSKQRAGRAGRVQDGFYYALFSKERSRALRAVGLPELLRSDLQTTCLSIKAQNFGEPVANFLSQAIEPPSKQAVDVAIENLISIEAFTTDQELTALGRILSQLPVHPTLSKMILLGIVFRCLDPMIILGASAEERSLFVTPLHAREDAKRAFRAYGGDSQSDHIAMLRAFDELRSVRDDSGMGAVQHRAREMFLHFGAFRNIDQTAKQVVEILTKVGLIAYRGQQTSVYGPRELNRNSKNHELVKALILAGSHPNLAVKRGGMVYRTPTEQATLMHPSSLNAEGRRNDNKVASGTMYAYSTLSRSADGNTLFLKDSTQVTPLMAVLFGGQLRMTGHGRLEMEEWLPFFVKSDDRRHSTRLLLEFRKALDRVLNDAFGSLSELRPGELADLASNSLRDQFAQRVVEVLRDGSNAFPSYWRDNDRRFALGTGARYPAAM